MKTPTKSSGQRLTAHDGAVVREMGENGGVGFSAPGKTTRRRPIRIDYCTIEALPPMTDHEALSTYGPYNCREPAPRPHPRPDRTSGSSTVSRSPPPTGAPRSGSRPFSSSNVSQNSSRRHASTGTDTTACSPPTLGYVQLSSPSAGRETTHPSAIPRPLRPPRAGISPTGRGRTKPASDGPCSSRASMRSFRSAAPPVAVR